MQLVCQVDKDHNATEVDWELEINHLVSAGCSITITVANYPR